MAARGYVSLADIAHLLGTDDAAVLTINQVERINGGLLEAAENLIDAYTGRAWLTGATVVGERHTIQGGRVWLNHKPITAVSAVRLGGAFETGALLAATTDYVVEPARGLITFRDQSWGDVAVDYSVPQTVPADVAEAAGLLVVGQLTSAAALTGSAGLYESISMDGQTLRYRNAAQLGQGVVLPSVEKLLARWRRPVLA